MWLNIGCGTHRAPEPWWNIDCVENEITHPDQVVPAGEFPWPDDSVERVYLGHVLEHMYWGRPLVHFLTEVRRILVPAGIVLATGPDFEKTIQGYRDGRYGWELMESVAEHARGEQDLVGDWPEARHHWNCTLARMLLAFRVAGFEPSEPLTIEGWPAVGWDPTWQSAVQAVK